MLDKYNTIKEFKPAPKKKIRVGLYNSRFKDEIEKIDAISVVPMNTSPLVSNVEDVDLFLDTIDSSFTESLDLLQYNKTFGIFDVTDEDMKNYVDAETKEIRIKLLQEIHYKSIMEGFFINIGVAPYYTILSKEWEAEPSKFFVGFPVWKITKKN
jgi:hypothetical protein